MRQSPKPYFLSSKRVYKVKHVGQLLKTLSLLSSLLTAFLITGIFDCRMLSHDSLILKFPADSN